MPEAKLLLVDDETAFTDILAQRLRRRGFAVACVDSGPEAIIRLKENRLPDVMVLDLKMPGLNGIETIEQVKRRWPLIEVLFLTGHATVESAVVALQHGAFDYLRKPYELDDLIVKIRAAACRKRRHEAQIREVLAKPYISERERDESVSRILSAGRKGKSAGE